VASAKKRTGAARKTVNVAVNYAGVKLRAPQKNDKEPTKANISDHPYRW
jgi:hypothetical protein